MTREQYRAHPALNFSLAKHLLRSPAHFRAAVDEEREETDAMRIGTLAHSMVLEGKNLLDLYAIKPEGMSFATKEGKEWRDKQTLPILKEEDANAIPRIAEAIIENPDAAKILKGCQSRETPIIASMHGVECKCLIDLHDPASGKWTIGDFKTAQDASLREFANNAYRMDYDMQAAWYSDLLAISSGIENAPWWFWIVTEKKPPFVNAVYIPSDELMQSGREKVQRALNIYNECMESGEWPMPLRGIHAIQLPRWAGKGDA
jgi:exodeoxyribonuclease VIII